MNLDNIYLITKIIFSVLMIIGAVVAGLWKWCPRIKSIFASKKTVILVNDDPGFQNFWHISSTGGKDPKPLLQVSCHLMVTNITDRPVGLVQAIWKGSIKGEAFTRQVSVKDLSSQCFGNYDVPSGARTGAAVHFMISSKKMPKIGESIELDIGIIDQYGNTHWIKKVSFRSS